MKHILVIEDEEVIRSNVVDLLQLEGYRAISAENGQVGVRLARQHLPHLIICDIMMPGLDGYGVLETLSRDPVTATIPFIFLTAKAEKIDIRQGMARGADDYLTKPFTQEELLLAIGMRFSKQDAVTLKFQQQLDQLRSSIALSLPHELRTPLTGILGFSSVIVDNFHSLAGSEVLEMAQLIRTSAEQLHRLIENYLLYAELDMMSVQSDQGAARRLAAEPFALKSLLTQTAVQSAGRANRASDLQLDVDETCVAVSQAHLKKIVEEVVDNAFKYSTAGTPVQVAGRSGVNGVALCVTDRGRGMTAEQIARVAAYVQFDRRIHEQQGSGLGLTLARRLAELYGGSLVIDSVPGERTTVSISLPAGR